MIQEDNKDLLLKYLCMALPYEVICNDNRHGSGRVTNIDITPDDIEHKNPKVVLYYFDFDECGGLNNCRPYLRPLSTMTEEEAMEYANCGNIIAVNSPQNNYLIPNPNCVNWLLKNHFDFMGLIPAGLAIAVTENNNPYK